MIYRITIITDETNPTNIKEVLERVVSDATDKNISLVKLKYEDIIDEVLFENEIRKGLKGYRYIKEAIKIMMLFEDMDNLLITKDVYVDIASTYNTTWSCVEKNIRTVISKSKLKGKANTIALSDLCDMIKFKIREREGIGYEIDFTSENNTK